MKKFFHPHAILKCTHSAHDTSGDQRHCLLGQLSISFPQKKNLFLLSSCPLMQVFIYEEFFSYIRYLFYFLLLLTKYVFSHSCAVNILTYILFMEQISKYQQYLYNMKVQVHHNLTRPTKAYIINININLVVHNLPFRQPSSILFIFDGQVQILFLPTI